MNERRNSLEVMWGVPLIVLGVVILLGNFFNLGHLIGGLITGAIGAAFVWVFLTDHRHWWALIPGGVLLGSALSVLLPWTQGSLSTLGLGLGFMAIWYLTTPYNHQSWAIWPGGILTIIGVLHFFGAIGVGAYLWPLVLIGIGVWLLTRVSHRS